MSYDTNNIFARILRGELPCIKLYEDEHTLSFMDIMPRADGHLLVIPKTPCRNVLDASPEQLAAVMQTVQKLSKAVIKAFSADQGYSACRRVFHQERPLEPPGGPLE